MDQIPDLHAELTSPIISRWIAWTHRECTAAGKRVAMALRQTGRVGLSGTLGKYAPDGSTHGVRQQGARLFWGGNAMSNLAKILSTFVVWFAAGSASAVTPPVTSPPLPFVKVIVPKKPLYLNGSWATGGFRASGKADIRVVANCPYLVQASFRDLVHRTGRTWISPQDLSVAINGEQMAPGGRVEVVRSWQPTLPQGVEVPVSLELGVKNPMNHSAGRYDGELVIRVMAAP